MSFRHDPATSLADMLDNIARIETYTAGLTREAFADDDRTRDAVERCLERICEAVHRLGDKAPSLMPNQPWPDIRGMGNRLRHAYDHVSLDIIWGVIRNRLPSLKADVTRALSGLPH